MSVREDLNACIVPARNVPFNPTFDTIDAICKRAGDEGFALSHVVQVSHYSWVAVFIRPGELHPAVPSVKPYGPPPQPAQPTMDLLHTDKRG